MQNSTFTYDSRLDSTFLESIYENDKEDAAFGFEQFLNSYPAQLNELEQSFETGDVNSFRQKIHKLKPTFSFVGLTNVTAKAEIIEKNCQETAEIQVLTDLYLDFKNTLSELIPVVENQFSKLTTQ